jgi:hypothetical protein
VHAAESAPTATSTRRSFMWRHQVDPDPGTILAWCEPPLQPSHDGEHGQATATTVAPHTLLYGSRGVLDRGIGMTGSPEASNSWEVDIAVASILGRR